MTVDFADIREVALPNGLRAFHWPGISEDSVSVQLWHGFGSFHDPRGRSGLAHFLEHMMFNGSAAFPAGEYDIEIESVGGDSNAATWLEWTFYRATIPASSIDTVCRMESDRLSALLLDPAQVDVERQVILDERRQTVDDDPDAKAEEWLAKTIFGNHHYSRPVIGTAGDIEAITRADLVSFHANYRSRGSAIVICGGATKPVEQALQAFAAVETTAAAATQIEEPSPTAKHFVHECAVPLARVHGVFIGPGMGQEEWSACQVLCRMLSDGPASILGKALILEKSLVSHADVGIQETANPGQIRVSLYAMPHADVQQIEDIARQHMSEDLLNQERLQAAKARCKYAIHRELSELDGRGEFLGSRLVAGFSLPDVQRSVERIDNITLDHVQSACRRYLQPSLGTWGHIVPRQ